MPRKKLPPSHLRTPEGQKVLSHIDEFGCHIINVMGDDEGPPHSFSVGLFQRFQHPEILIIGLKTDLMQDMINWMTDDILKGGRFEVGQYYQGFLEGFDITFGNVANQHYREYLGYAKWFYQGEMFPTIQCIWPTTKGYFPWDKKYPKSLLKRQPLLDNLALP